MDRPFEMHDEKTTAREEAIRMFEALGMRQHFQVREWEAAGAGPEAIRSWGSTTFGHLALYVRHRALGKRVPLSLIAEIRTLADSENRALFEALHADYSQTTETAKRVGWVRSEQVGGRNHGLIQWKSSCGIPLVVETRESRSRMARFDVFKPAGEPPTDDTGMPIDRSGCGYRDTEDEALDLALRLSGIV